MADPRGVVIAAPASGAGKTLITLGLLHALVASGKRVASAKVGPDYIDPRFHEAVTGRASPNLDGWAMRPALVHALARRAAKGADLFVVEGVMGLFDGAASGAGSTADIAAALSLPVVLVVDAQAQAQSAAAVVKGFASFREDCRIAAVIFNRTGSPEHEVILRRAVAPLGIPVLGAVPREPGLILPSRHLGLVQAAEQEGLQALLERAGESIARGVDLDALAAIAGPVGGGGREHVAALPPLGQRMAVARDAAFAFAYPHLLDAWHEAGAQVIPFSPLAGEAPDPDADAVYLPGGYPELHAGALSARTRLFAAIRQRAEAGALVYGECGGFMVLGEGLIDAEGVRHAMAGLLPFATSFAEPKLHLGYRGLAHAGALPWPRRLRGHEFHYSRLVAQDNGAAPLFEVEDSCGRSLGPAGLRLGTVMGSYIHVVDGEGSGDTG